LNDNFVTLSIQGDKSVIQLQDDPLVALNGKSDKIVLRDVTVAPQRR